MFFLIIVFALFIISFFWAVFSLRKEMKKPKEVKDVENELKREKILFKA